MWDRTISALGARARCNVGNTLQDATLVAMALRILAQAPSRFVLAGVSMGGMVALEIMRAAPGRVAGLALIDTNAQPDTPEQVAYRRMVNVAVLQMSYLVALAGPAIRSMVHAEVDPSVHGELEDMTRRVSAKIYARQSEALLARGDLRPVLATIKAPTMVMVGAQDTMTPLASSRSCGGIAGAELHIIPDCGDLPPIEKPQGLADLLRRPRSAETGRG